MVKQYINGQLVDGLGAAIPVTDPATGEVFDSFPGATADQARQALEAAQRAFESWSWTPLGQRVD